MSDALPRLTDPAVDLSCEPTLAAPCSDNLLAMAGTRWPMGARQGFGMPGERLAQRAAQRSFLGLKQCFMAAADTLDGRRGAWLRQQVVQAQEPIDLWLLRGALTAALVAAEGVALAGLAPTDGLLAEQAQGLGEARRALQRELATVFADALDWPTAEFPEGSTLAPRAAA